MLKFGNKEFRNLQEQVKKNMDDILFILQEEGVLNEFGIKVVGQEDSVLDMPTVDDYKEDNPEWGYGDAYAVGTEAPYELYILTRANGTHPNDYWFNIGEFPVPGPEGPQGPEGETGPQGPTGPSGQDGVSPEISIGSVSATTLSASASATASVSMTGTYAQPVLNFTFGIPQGEDGSTPSSIAWGSITGSLADQTDLVSALQGKANASALSSYATVSQLSEYALASVVSAIDYLSVGALSSSTVIPSVYGTNDGTNWTSLTIDGDTYGFAAGGGGGGNAQWGSISGTLSNQEDLMSKFSEYALLTDIPSLSGYATESWVLSQNYLSAVPSEYATQSWVSEQGYLTSIPSEYATETYVQNQLSDYAKASALSSYALSSSLSLYATVSALSSAISGVNSTISSLDYLSVGALSSETVIPDITGLASEGYVNSAISGLSSIYAYATDVASMNYASVHALSEDTVIPDITGLASEGYVDSSISALSSVYASIGAIPSMSEYAKLNASNTFVSANQYAWSYLPNDIVGGIKGENNELSINATSQLTLDVGGRLYANAGGNIDVYASTNNNITFYKGNIYYGAVIPNASSWTANQTLATQDWVSSNFLSSGYVPVVSGYAKLSSANKFTSSNTFTDHTYFNNANIMVNNGVIQIRSSSTAVLPVMNIQHYGQDCALWYFNDLIIGKADGFYGVTFPSNTSTWSSNKTVATLDDLSGYVNLGSSGSIYADSGIRMTTPSGAYGINLVSPYIYLGGGSPNTHMIGITASSISYTLLSQLGSMYMNCLEGGSTLYFPNPYSFSTNKTLVAASTSMSEEVWTFTLSDNTSVSKTILVG